MDIQIFQEFYDNGITALPIIWDNDKRIADAHPEHDLKKVRIDITYVQNLLAGSVNKFESFRNANAVAIKVIPPLGMFDFDMKNTPNKGIFDEWLLMIQAQCPDVMSRICIEKTRSGGYHVYFKYAKLEHKIMLAQANNGKEVISVYTGELLSYCSPTQGYEIVHNYWNDIDFITDDEYQLMIQCGAYFHEESEIQAVPDSAKVLTYPIEYESVCQQFDNKLPDDLYETLLNSIGLFRNKDQRPYQRKPWVAFTREGSNAAYSAKVYFRSKRTLIFSASMPKFPSWNDSAKLGADRWSLSPSKLVYYKNERDWQKTIDEINCICESANIEIQLPNVTQQPLPLNPDRLKFPYDILPDEVYNYIHHQTIQHEYLASAALVAASTAIGNSVQLEAIDGYIVKPVMYLAIVASPGSSKTPALKKMFAPLEHHDAKLYDLHKAAIKEYKTNLADAKKNKAEEPEQPQLRQTLIKDSTIEMVIKILSNNPDGCSIFSDELSGFLKRMNQYKDGDEVQKWLELWSGAPILLQRISREENKVQEPYCNIIGGIQPGVLESLSKEDNQHNGFYHRFLFCFPTPNEKPDFNTVAIPHTVKSDFTLFFSRLLAYRQSDKQTYILSPEALEMYKEWFSYKNQKYNRAINDNVKGIIAKYQDYCLRFAILIQVINQTSITGMVSQQSMNGAIRLTEYFLGNMHKALKILAPESPVDKLNDTWQRIYSELNPSFSTKTFVTIAKQHNISEAAAKVFLQRNIKKLFDKVRQGEYEKLI
jgi:hypothetical protein